MRKDIERKAKRRKNKQEKRMEKTEESHNSLYVTKKNKCNLSV